MSLDHHTEERPMRRVPAARSHDYDGHDEPPAQNDHPKKGKYGWFLLLVLGLVLFLAVLAFFGIKNFFSNRHEQAETGKAVQAGAVTVQVVKPTRSPPSFDFSLPGSAEALNTATLYARVNGYLKSRLVDIGDRVEAGQLLAVIDAPELDAQLNQTRAQLDQFRAAQGIAQVTFEREQRLLAQKVVSKQEYDQSEAAFNQAVANVKSAEASVQNLTAQQGFERITAPFTGVITTRYLDDGALISSGGGTTAPSLYTLVQADTLRVFINVPQSYVANLSVGQETSVSAADFPQKVFKGRLTRMAESLDPASRTERVEIQIPSEGGKLLPGMYLTIRFQVQQDEPALMVPSNTVDIRREGPRVAVMAADKTLKYQKVKLGRDFGKNIEIVEGLTGNETLVVNPSTDLVEGMKVEVAQDNHNGEH